ncbi:hypothetical protein MRB53_037558 [Persea americana]|nr:hypothetical protein MRB53_037558 [Persea americana]
MTEHDSSVPLPLPWCHAGGTESERRQIAIRLTCFDQAPVDRAYMRPTRHAHVPLSPSPIPPPTSHRLQVLSYTASTPQPQ